MINVAMIGVGAISGIYLKNLTETFSEVKLLGVCDLKTAAFYTTNKDKYYHLNTACDDGTKYPISGEAAVLFGKRACPVCTKKTQPVYTGECEFVWNREEPMWELNGLDLETLAQVRKSLPEQFYEESRITGEKFDSIFYEVYNKKTGEFSMSYPWPENYAGKYVNMAYAKTFLLVDPTEESIEEFKRVCGGGVWVVAAKYGMTELEQAREEAVTLVEEYCETHPELDARWVGHGLDIYRNTVNLEIYGSDAQMLIDSVEFPLCVRAEVVYSLPTTMDFPEN